jgi:ferredoxin-NADP reductase/predicted pyridoxine 5'-phosphate oxidase superfamily flavin-nucleotide-binding protein
MYAAMEAGEDYNHSLGEREASFISARDSFYIASVSETGWPYVQHRGGPPGFVRVIDERTIGFADFSGNRQYVSVGNVKKDDRVSLFFMDYPNQTRLKLLGRVRLIAPQEAERLADLGVDDYPAHVERGFLIHIEAFDWNCPQHITPRFTESQMLALMAPPIGNADHPPSLATPPTTLGDGPLELIVSGVRQLTPRVRAFELRDPNGSTLPEVEAGSHLKVPVRLAGGETTVRQYSICSNPARRDLYEIAVLREDDGAGASRAIHDMFGIGLRLRCDPPENHFRLHTDERPAVLVAGGIGITPVKAMAESLKARDNIVQLHYAGRSRQEMAFRDRLLRGLGNEVTFYSSSDGERMDVERILSVAPDDAVFYVCGPERLIDAVTDVTKALAIDSTRVRFERFAAIARPDDRPIQVELRRSGKRFEVGAHQSVLDAILEACVDAPFSCRAGNCRTCAVKVLDGEPDHRDSALATVEREEYRLMCPCVSRAHSDYLVLDI